MVRGLDVGLQPAKETAVIAAAYAEDCVAIVDLPQAFPQERKRIGQVNRYYPDQIICRFRKSEPQGCAKAVAPPFMDNDDVGKL